ncbi:MAG: gamma-glutamyltransferase family protein [Herbaspirillum sp.]
MDSQAACQVDAVSGSATTILPGSRDAPEIATGYIPKDLVKTRSFMAITNNPISTQIACRILQQGGTAADALVAAQMALNLVEPQSSGIGGGAFILYYDAKTRNVISYDGRETAPAGSNQNYLRWKSATDQTAPMPNAQRSGRSIGTPGVLRALELLQAEHGVLPWHQLFVPAIKLARDGFVVPARMAASISSPATVAMMRRDPQMAAYFLDTLGNPRLFNTVLKNPELAHTFDQIALHGASAFYQDGPIARAIVASIRSDFGNSTTAGATTLADLANYRAKKRTPVCSDYRQYVVCGMPPPSSGGIAIAQTLGVLEYFDLSGFAPTALDRNGGKPNVTGVHLVVEAENLAYADRNKYVADTDFVPLPGGNWGALLDKNYLRLRAALINPAHAMRLPAPPGQFNTLPLAAPQTPEHGTTQVSLMDRFGNVAVMTTTIEAALGSFHMTNGFLLNNQLTDFSASPEINGVTVANRVQAGKRPRSSMAPTLVFRKNVDGSRGDFVMATGSPGGATIIQYVLKTLVGVLDWNLDAQQAVAMIDFGGNNFKTVVGGEHPNVDVGSVANGLPGDADPLVHGLRAIGHTVDVTAQSSGLSAIVKLPSGVLAGGADPRREGVVMGDPARP